MVDESQQAVQERQARRAAIADVGEDSGPDSGGGSGSGSGSEDSQDEIDPIVQKIEQWKADTQEQQLQVLKNMPIVEIDL